MWRSGCASFSDAGLWDAAGFAATTPVTLTFLRPKETGFPNNILEVTRGPPADTGQYLGTHVAVPIRESPWHGSR